MMTENFTTTPYIIQISEPFQTIHLAEDVNNLGVQLDPTVQDFPGLSPLNNSQILLEPSDKPIEIVQDSSENFEVVGQEEPCIFQIVYPQELSLSPATNMLKRGRPKKKKEESQTPQTLPSKTDNPCEPPKSARTRSGRLVKLPKYIEKDFKKIETSTDQHEVQVSDFKRFDEKENTKTEFAELQTKKRVISAQYKCPKCFKAYLGKNKMIQHLKKYPDHGPLPEGYQEFNFDVWNYLFDITQKCKSGQRGVKFCEELSNLLHNVQLLKNALFKTVTDNKNCVHIDKVLGNAIGLPPGKYKFDETELYKDVTVLKLITNSDFFKPNVNNKQNCDNAAKSKPVEELDTEIKCKNGTLDKLNEDYNLVSSEINEGKVSLTDCGKKMEVDSQIALSSELLNDNLLLHSLPNPRNSEEELMLTNVDNTSNLLDNSTSSDEVMNVDQFVNERFKKIIEPDIELSNTSLNLDLPSLELFQFHTS